MGNGRRALLATLWLATAVGAGLLGAWLLRQPPEIRFRDVPGGAPPSPSPPGAPGPPPSPGGGGPAAPGGSVSHDDTVPGGRGPAADAAAPAPAAPFEPCFAEVAVLGLDGTPAEGGTVYALGAGEPGADEPEEVCHAELGEGGKARLALPGPGLYDVGWTGYSTGDMESWALAADVRASPGAPAKVLLRVPGGQTVRVEIEPPWPPPNLPRARAIVLLEEAGGRPVRFPGRGQRGPRSATIILHEDEASGESPPLPPGSAWSVTAGLEEPRAPRWGGPPAGDGEHRMEQSWRCELVPLPPTVRAGEAVGLRLRTYAALEVRVRGEALAPAAPAGKAVHVRFAVELARAGSLDRREISVGAGGDPPWTTYLWFRGDPGPCTLRWSGEGVQAGSRPDIVLRAGEFPAVEVLLLPDPGGVLAPAPEGEVPPGPPAPEEEVLEILPEGLPSKEAPLRAVALAPGEDGGLEALEEDEVGWIDEAEGTGGWSLYPRWRRAPRIRFGSGADLASAPAAPPATGPIRVALRPAGLLCVVPDRVPDASFGRLRLRLADGSPLPRFPDGVWEWTDVEPGLLLGPLPEGAHAFEVRLGGVRLPDAVGTVRAGRIEVLRIRTSR